MKRKIYKLIGIIWYIIMLLVFYAQYQVLPIEDLVHLTILILMVNFIISLIALEFGILFTLFFIGNLKRVKYMQFKDFYLKVNIGENEAKLYEQKYLILIKIGKFEYYSIDDLKEKSIEVIKKLKHSQLIKMEMIKEID